MRINQHASFSDWTVSSNLQKYLFQLKHVKVIFKSALFISLLSFILIS